jgi:TonB family protein
MTFHENVTEKNNGGIGLNSMIVFSFLLHALVLSIIFFSPSMPTPRWTFGPVYSVNLVSPPAHLMGNKAVTSISGDILGMDSGNNNSVALRKEVKRISFPPVTGITALKSTSLKRSITGKAGEAGDTGRRVPSSANASGTTIQRRNAEMSMNMRVYYSTIWSMIKGKWALPRGIVPNDNIEAVLSAKILKNGVVADLSFEKRSGNRYFDESAMRAIKKASPFPPLPGWIKTKSIEVGLRFHSSELR